VVTLILEALGDVRANKAGATEDAHLHLLATRQGLHHVDSFKRHPVQCAIMEEQATRVIF
jgi:hypothetical protein